VRGLAIGTVRIYQQLAPRRVRERCRFHPSCSEYAIDVLRRHGLAGLPRIVDRLRRCRPPNGGEDWP
jgi:putative membrane protein insertion efficiency factor